MSILAAIKSAINDNVIEGRSGEWLGRRVHDGSGGQKVGEAGSGGRVNHGGPWALGPEGFGLKKLNLHLLGSVSLYSPFHSQNSRKRGLHLLFPPLPSSLSLYHVLSIFTGSPASKAQLICSQTQRSKRSSQLCS